MECNKMNWSITEYKRRLVNIRLLIVHLFRYRCWSVLRVGVKKQFLQLSNAHLYHWLFQWHETFDNSSTCTHSLRLLPQDLRLSTDLKWNLLTLYWGLISSLIYVTLIPCVNYYSRSHKAFTVITTWSGRRQNLGLLLNRCFSKQQKTSWELLWFLCGFTNGMSTKLDKHYRREHGRSG